MLYTFVRGAFITLSCATLGATRDLVVAIYGGGAASATFAHAIKDYSHIDLQYFDPALNLTPTSFRLYGFAPSVHFALDQISEEAGGAINRAGWYAEDPSLVVVDQGPDAGTVILDWAKQPNTTHHPEVTVVDPAAYLMQMLNPVGKRRLHPNKTLISVTQQKITSTSDFPLGLYFQDGTNIQADVLVGDDGAFGNMRGHVLGPSHPATAPVFMNFLSAVAHVPVDQAKKYLGPKFGDKKAGRRFEHIGQGSWFLSAYLDGFFTTLGSFYTGESYDLSQFTRSTTVEELKARFGGLADGEGVVKVLSTFSGLRLIPEIEHPHAPTYVNGRIAMIGNAAHTMTNFQQLGPSQDVEDAMILGAVLGQASAGDDYSIDAALYAFDEVRRPRSQWVAEHGKRLGMLWTGMVEGVGIDVAKLRAQFLQWKDDSEAFDAKRHKEAALELMKKKLHDDKGNHAIAYEDKQEVLEL
ncbi:hypothetical protein ACN47E_008110 [Coniothyrium glycines]